MAALAEVGGPLRVWRTENGGRTWQELAHNLPSRGIRRLQFATAGTGWALKGSEVWRTEDGGVNWHQSVVNRPQDILLEDMVFMTAEEGWIIGQGVVFHTTDGGRTWTLQYDTTRAAPRFLANVQFVSPTEGWIAGDGALLLHTTDAGATWRPVLARHPRMGPYDDFTSVHFLSRDVGVVAGAHSQREAAPKAVRERASPIAFEYYRPYILVTFDGGRSWSYHDLPIPVGQWSRVGMTLFGINTVNAFPGPTGIVEVKLNPPTGKRLKR